MIFQYKILGFKWSQVRARKIERMTNPNPNLTEGWILQALSIVFMSFYFISDNAPEAAVFVDYKMVDHIREA